MPGVGLEHFAALGGKTQEEYAQTLIKTLEQGKLLDLLTIEAQADFMGWASAHSFEQGERTFFLSILLSINRKKQVGIFCECKIDMTGEEPKVMLIRSSPGIQGSTPKWFKPKVAFELSLCDLEIPRNRK